MKKWRILDSGGVCDHSKVINFTCINCGEESELPVIGIPIAQISGGIVFDGDSYAIPNKIQCRHCRRQLEVENVR